MDKFVYIRENPTIYDFDTFYGQDGEIFTSQRKCFIDALQKTGVTDIPFEDLTEYSLEVACLAHNIYVQFVEE